MDYLAKALEEPGRTFKKLFSKNISNNKNLHLLHKLFMTYCFVFILSTVHLIKTKAYISKKEHAKLEQIKFEIRSPLVRCRGHLFTRYTASICLPQVGLILRLYPDNPGSRIMTLLL